MSYLFSSSEYKLFAKSSNYSAVACLSSTLDDTYLTIVANNSNEYFYDDSNNAGIFGAISQKTLNGIDYESYIGIKKYNAIVKIAKFNLNNINFYVDTNIKGDILPYETNEYNIGSSSYKWNDIYSSSLITNHLNVIGESEKIHIKNNNFEGPSLRIDHYEEMSDEIFTLWNFYKDTNNQYTSNIVITANKDGNVGIGTKLPVVSLQIEHTDALKIPKGSTSDRPVSNSETQRGYIRYNTSYNKFEGFGAGDAWGSLGGVIDVDRDTYISAELSDGTDNDELRFFTYGSERMRILNNGNVGIGTKLPVVSLQIENKDALKIPKGSTSDRPLSNSETHRGYIRYNTSYNKFEGFGAGDAWGSLGGVIDVDRDTYISAELSDGADNDELRFFTYGSERMKILNNGNIGVGTDAPVVSFQIQHTDALKIPKGTTGERPLSNSDEQQGYIRYNTTTKQFEGFGAGNAWGSLGGVIDVDKDTYISAELNAEEDNDELLFYTFGNERMRILKNGKIGIGTHTPNVSLQIQHTDALKIPKGTTGERPLSNSDEQQGYIRYNTTTKQFEGFGAGNAWGSLGGVMDVNQDTYISAELSAGSNNDELIFVTSNIERMRISKNSKINIYGNTSNIGVFTITSNLYVEGNQTINGIVTVNNNLYVSDTLYASNLSVLGDTTIVNTVEYTAEKLHILHDEYDGPALKIDHMSTVTNEVLSVWNSVTETPECILMVESTSGGSGKIGINVSTPQYVLDVEGTTQLSGDVIIYGETSNYGDFTITSNLQVNYDVNASNFVGSGKHLYDVNLSDRNLDMISQGTSNKFIINDVYESDLYIAGKLMVTDIEIVDLDYILSQNLTPGSGNLYEYINTIATNIISNGVTSSPVSELFIGNVGESASIFMGGGGVNDSGYNNSVIESREYSTNKSELIIFKGKDSQGADGADRIRLRAGGIAFDTYPSGSISRTDENIRMYINSNGNVGINTVNPNYNLDVNGSFNTASISVKGYGQPIIISYSWNATGQPTYWEIPTKSSKVVIYITIENSFGIFTGSGLSPGTYNGSLSYMFNSGLSYYLPYFTNEGSQSGYWKGWLYNVNNSRIQVTEMWFN